MLLLAPVLSADPHFSAGHSSRTPLWRTQRGGQVRPHDGDRFAHHLDPLSGNVSRFAPKPFPGRGTSTLTFCTLADKASAARSQVATSVLGSVADSASAPTCSSSAPVWRCRPLRPPSRSLRSVESSPDSASVASPGERSAVFSSFTLHKSLKH